MTHPQRSVLTARQLVTMFTGLADRIAHAADTADGLTAITAVAVSDIAGTDFASISRHRGDHFQTLAPTEPAATAADRLQYDLASGPCVEAILTDSILRTGDLRTDTRWPVYGPRSFLEFGVLSMLSIRLVLDAADDLDASLNLYSRRPDAFTDDTVTVAMLLATHGATAVSRLIAHNETVNLAAALGNSRTIGTAVGILVATERLSTDQAFDLLRITSQQTNRKLVAVADEVVEQGVIPR